MEKDIAQMQKKVDQKLTLEKQKLENEEKKQIAQKEKEMNIKYNHTIEKETKAIRQSLM